ncbi:a-pheromone processing metallopeptidase ste23 [Botrytis cinerea]
MDVNVGSFSDPDDVPGTARAVELFCFMGTKKVSYRHTDILNTQQRTKEQILISIA